MPYTFKHGDRPLEGVTVQRAVGRGGFGEVYYALMDSGKQVALKYLRENPEIELRGIAHVMNLKSPHLITIYDVKQSAAGEPFVIMEYISGPSLRDQLIAEPQGLGVQKAAFFMKGICRGLSYLHERGIVHRDLKPANIFYDDGYVKIGDYGLSKHMSVSRHSGQTVSVGTVHYMAPEIGSGNYTQAIDIYALGVILFEMLTGRLPYTGSSMAEILMRHLRDQPDLAGIPTPFAQVIAKALAKDPKDRYQSADEMLAVVMDSANISESVASFDATALSQVPRVPEGVDPDRTVTRPHMPPPLPMLDARDVAPRAELPDRLQKKIDRFGERLEQKVARLEKKFGPRRRGVYAEQGPAGLRRHRGRKGHIFVLLLIAVGIAFLLGAMYNGNRGDPPAAVPIAFFIIGGTAGLLLARLRLLKNVSLGSGLLDRLAQASIAGLFMLPAYGIAMDTSRLRDLAPVIVAPLAALVVCDWRRRIEQGRVGHVSAGATVWPAIAGLIAASMATNVQGAALVGAGVCAAISLLAQAAAGLWPQARPAVAEPNILGAAAGPNAAQRLGIQPPTSPAPNETPPIVAQPHTDDTGASPPYVQQRSALEVAQPSFAGRTAHAGVSFLGKLLLLAGLAIALGQGPLQDYAKSVTADGQPFVDRAVDPVIVHGIPSGVVVLALLGGSLLLVAARRREGAWHFVRGCFGSVLVFVGALLGMVGGKDGFKILFGQADLAAFFNAGEERVLPVIFCAVFLGLGALLLLWPSKAQRERPIVI